MATLPKSNTTLPITARKKAVPGIKPVEPPVPSLEEKPLPKKEVTKVEPKKPAPPKAQPKPAPKPPAKKVVELPKVKKELTPQQEELLALINRRQRQLVVHSVIYYRMNESIISDETFDTWSRELVKLHREHPEVAEYSVFWDIMQDFDGSTGFHLADNSWGIGKAHQILSIHRKMKEGVKTA